MIVVDLPAPDPSISADAVRAITEPDVRRLQHALGIASDVKRSKWGYRNRYVAPTANADVMGSCRRLVAAGFMVAAGEERAGMQNFRATELGCFVAGLTKSQTRSAVRGL